MGLRRYRQFVRVNNGSAEATSFVEGSISGVAMSIFGSDTGDFLPRPCRLWPLPTAFKNRR